MMLIGDLAERAGVSTRTIRYYEELGMIQPEARTSGGFRRYADEQLRRLDIISNLKVLGFELERISQLFTLHHSKETRGDLATAMIGLLDGQQLEIDQYMAMKAGNAKGIEILRDCLSCSIAVFERDCHNCDVYRRHEVVPDLVESAIYGT
jgi:DNA-binding transcriptional MerR regulator